MRIVLVLLLLLFSTPAMAVATGDKNKAQVIVPDDPTKPMYVDLPPFVLPVLNNKGPQELVSMMLSLEVLADENMSTEEKGALIKKRLPRLNDAYVQMLYGKLDSRAITPNGLVNVALVKQKLMIATNNVLGSGIVNDVLVQGVAQRKLHSK